MPATQIVGLFVGFTFFYKQCICMFHIKCQISWHKLMVLPELIYVLYKWPDFPHQKLTRFSEAWRYCQGGVLLGRRGKGIMLRWVLPSRRSKEVMFRWGASRRLKRVMLRWVLPSRKSKGVMLRWVLPSRRLKGVMLRWVLLSRRHKGIVLRWVVPSRKD